MRTHVTRADAPRSDAAHQARAANVVDAATTVRARQEARISEPYVETQMLWPRRTPSVPTS